jgi:hypothetical protein
MDRPGIVVLGLACAAVVSARCDDTSSPVNAPPEPCFELLVHRGPSCFATFLIGTG